MDLARTEHRARSTEAVAGRWQILRRLVDRMHAASDTGHAPDTTQATLLDYVESILEEDTVVGYAALSMLLLGLRARDLEHLKKKQIHIDDRFIQCEVRISKQRSHRRERICLKIPRAWLGLALCPYVQDLQNYIANLDDQDFIFPCGRNESLATSINQHLQLVSTDTGDVRLTSYSFRRHYIQNLASRFTNDDGVVDLNSLQRYTLHLDQKTLGAYYLTLPSDQTH